MQDQMGSRWLKRIVSSVRVFFLAMVDACGGVVRKVLAGVLMDRVHGTRRCAGTRRVGAGVPGAAVVRAGAGHADEPVNRRGRGVVSGPDWLCG